MIQQVTHNYAEAIQAIKQAILKSRYNAAVLANREMLMLYFGVGEYISKNSRQGAWGTNAIEVISRQLQNELPGQRGFSATNIKNMRLFYEAWMDVIPNRQMPSADLDGAEFVLADKGVVIRQTLSADLSPEDINAFMKVGFSNHREIIKLKSLDERLFYIRKAASEFWSFEKLKYNLKSDLYAREGQIANNFALTIADANYRGKALRSFKDEYLLDFVNIEDPDEADEREIADGIVRNIKKFIMTLGNDFSFIGQEYRVVVADTEYFIDLLFFNRQLQSLVAVELKRGEFKPEYAGKLNFYLSALDEYVKKPHENPSVGIVLCKSQKSKVVEFAFRDTSKPMGVATYRMAKELPKEYQGILPDADKLIEALGNSEDE
jgi:predicted nuclease of restriction endonuclease-like (RecB) superfamily